MTAKRSGWLFFSIVMTYIGVLVAMGVCVRYGIEITIRETLWLSEGILVVPAFCFAAAAKEPLKDTVGFHKIRIRTIFLAILYIAMLGPLVTLCNAVTMLFVENEAAAIMDMVSELSYPGMFFYIAILAPLCEEMVFRGILYTGFRKNGTPLQAILWTAVLFGLFHMNINQMIYAMVLGIGFGLLREATGNIWAGIIGHMTLNGFNVLIFYIQSILPEDELAKVNGEMTQEMLLMTIGVYFVISLVTTAIAACVLVAIAKAEYGSEYLKQVFADKRKLKVWSVPLWIGILICAVIMALEFLSTKLQA